jgi:predicted ATP-grasp superfamily ATP-dependent carboligase
MTEPTSSIATTAAGAVVYPDNLAALSVCRGLGIRGVPVTIFSCDRTSPGQYSRYGHRVASPNLARDGEGAFVDFLETFGRSQRQRPVLFLTDDSSLVAVNRHRERLEKFYRFPMSPWPVLERLLYKDTLYAALEGVVPVPRTRIPASEADLPAVLEAVGSPALVKPRLRCLSDGEHLAARPWERLFGSKAVRVRTLAELTATYRRATAEGFTLIVQEEIAGPVSALHSVALYASSRGGVPAVFTSRKLAQVPEDYGDGLVVRAAWAPEVIPLAVRAVAHLDFFGIADIEFKLDEATRTFKLLDINPRPWLWMNLPTACGVNLAQAAYTDALGQPVDPDLFRQWDHQTRWVSMRGLAVAGLRALARGRAPKGLWDVLAGTRGHRVGPLFASDDPLTRMFSDPRYWWQSLRQAVNGMRDVRAAS